MKVLLDVTAEQRPGRDRGIGRYLVAVRTANGRLGHDVQEFACETGSSRIAELSAMVRRVRALRRREFDLFHAPTAYYAARDIRRRPTVTSILDVIPLDLHEHRQTGVKAQVVHRLAGRSDAVLTLSEHAASRLVALLGIDRTQIVVAPLPPGRSFVPWGRRATAAPSPYVAALADLRTPDPRKRASWIPVLASRLHGRGIALVVVGGGTEGLRLPGVAGLGRVDDEEWAAVLRGATAFVYTSAYEGQGLPPLEAIACGTPAVAMANTAIPEVVGTAGILVDEAGNAGVGHLAEQAVRVVEDAGLRSQLADQCAAQSAQFTIERFTEAVGRAYKLALQRS